MREKQTTGAKQKINLSDAAQLFKAIGDETRIRILGLLRYGELCVCDVMEVLKLPQSTASRHLAYLKNSAWVDGTRKGRWMYYKFREETTNIAVAQEIILFMSSFDHLNEDYQLLLLHIEKKQKKTCS